MREASAIADSGPLISFARKTNDPRRKQRGIHKESSYLSRRKRRGIEP